MPYRIPLKDCPPDEAARRRAGRAAYMRRWRAQQRVPLEVPSFDALVERERAGDEASWLIRDLLECGADSPESIRADQERRAREWQGIYEDQAREREARVSARRPAHAAKMRRLRAKWKADKGPVP